jgi:hypothetical protein
VFQLFIDNFRVSKCSPSGETPWTFRPDCTPEAEDISGLLQNFEGLIDSVQRPGAPIPFSFPERGAIIVNEVCHHANSPLSTDVITQPSVVSSLAMGFSVLTVATGASRLIQQLKSLVDRNVGFAGGALRSFVAGLNNPKISPDVVQREWQMLIVYWRH